MAKLRDKIANKIYDLTYGRARAVRLFLEFKANCYLKNDVGYKIDILLKTKVETQLNQVFSVILSKINEEENSPFQLKTFPPS